MIVRVTMVLALLAFAMPVHAERRGFTVTSFDRIVVNGPYVVRVTTGSGSSAYVEGDSQAVRQVSVSVTGRTMQVRRDSSNSWGGYPGENNGGSAILYVSTPELTNARVIGNGDVEIDRMSGGRVMAVMGGNGRLSVREIDSDTVSLNIRGAGVLEASGHAETGNVIVQGPGTLIAPRMTIENLTVNLDGPGNIEIASERQAEINSNGSGNVTVTGTSNCTDRSIGSGQVICGGL